MFVDFCIKTVVRFRKTCSANEMRQIESRVSDPKFSEQIFYPYSFIRAK